MHLQCTNEICIVSDKLNFRLFTDDTTILLTHIDSKILHIQVNIGLISLQDTLFLNKLTRKYINVIEYNIQTKREK